MNESTHFGDYGGKVLRPFKGGGNEWKPGDQLSVEDVESWPYQNRVALANVGKVQWYGEPANTKKKYFKAKKSIVKKTRTRKRKVK